MTTGRPRSAPEGAVAGPVALTLLHLDTDLGGNPDDAFALAMVLAWPGVEVTGITTVADPDGRRAGYVSHLLRLAGRYDVPVASGAAVSGTTGLAMGKLPDAERYWGEALDRMPSRPRAALELLGRSVDQGATVVAIGPYTNLAEFDRAHPNQLSVAQVFAMGGWFGPLDADLPPWGPQRDWNAQCDTDAALRLLSCVDVTWVPIAVTARTQLRAADLPRLRASGRLGRLLAQQAEANAVDRDLFSLARGHAGLPPDLVAFLHDPLTCAVALGWPGVQMEAVEVQPVIGDGVLRFDRKRGGKATRVVTAVDGPAFASLWLDRVTAARR